MSEDIVSRVSACDFRPEHFRYDQVECRRAELTDRLPYADDSFNYVIAVETMGHLADHERFFHEPARVLQRGGRHRAGPPDGLPHISSMTPDQFGDIGRRSGLALQTGACDRYRRRRPVSCGRAAHRLPGSQHARPCCSAGSCSRSFEKVDRSRGGLTPITYAYIDIYACRCTTDLRPRERPLRRSQRPRPSTDRLLPLGNPRRAVRVRAGRRPPRAAAQREPSLEAPPGGRTRHRAARGSLDLSPPHRLASPPAPGHPDVSRPRMLLRGRAPRPQQAARAHGAAEGWQVRRGNDAEGG